MESEKELTKAEITSRLRKIEGQVKGIQKMVEDEKGCGDVMVQIAAIRSAINKVGGLIMDRYIRICLKDTLVKEQAADELDEIIETIVKYVK